MGPERRRLEFSVGIFMIVGLISLAYLSFSLGNIGLKRDRYEVIAMFPTVAGLKAKSQVMMAGVQIGEVKKVQLKESRAEVIMSIDKNVQLEDDSIASIKTMGIIGDKYVSITPGASDTFLKDGGAIRETQPPLDIESLIAKFVFGGVEGKKSNDSETKPPGNIEKAKPGNNENKLPNVTENTQPDGSDNKKSGDSENIKPSE